MGGGTFEISLLTRLCKVAALSTRMEGDLAAETVSDQVSGRSPVSLVTRLSALVFWPGVVVTSLFARLVAQMSASIIGR